MPGWNDIPIVGDLIARIEWIKSLVRATRESDEGNLDKDFEAWLVGIDEKNHAEHESKLNIFHEVMSSQSSSKSEKSNW